jgi:tetratricopeptide (TPR) repeat protein
MKRATLIIGLLPCLTLAWAGAARGQETVHYLDRKTSKEATFTGLIQSETAAGITIKQGTTTKVIPAMDVTHVIYKVPNLKEVDYKTPFFEEQSGLDPKKTPKQRHDFLSDAQRDFTSLLPKVRDNPNALRYVQYRAAVLQVHIARDEPAKRAEAVAALNQFRKENSTGWEIVPCLKLLAQLQEEAGDLKGAEETYKELRVLPDVPKELKLESNILISNMLIRGKKFDEAEKTLREVQALMPEDDPQRPMIAIYLCQAQIMQHKTQDVEKQLTVAVRGTSDAQVLAVAHNTLGDYYRDKQQDEDAFWEYLRVDVLYPGDREEHAKALYWLSKLYDSVKKDKAKAQECVEKLKAKEFEGAEYARKLAAETK